MAYYKLESYKAIGLLLGSKLGHSQKECPVSLADWYIPIPSHKLRYKNRGFDHVSHLFEGPFKQWGIQSSVIICRHRGTRPLFGLTRAERRSQLRDVFSVLDEEKIKNRHICLYDDIVTTGATLDEVGRLLYMKGAYCVEAMTLCYVK